MKQQKQFEKIPRSNIQYFVIKFKSILTKVRTKQYNMKCPYFCILSSFIWSHCIVCGDSFMFLKLTDSLKYNTSNQTQIEKDSGGQISRFFSWYIFFSSQPPSYYSSQHQPVSLCHVRPIRAAGFLNFTSITSSGFRTVVILLF